MKYIKKFKIFENIDLNFIKNDEFEFKIEEKSEEHLTFLTKFFPSSLYKNIDHFTGIRNNFIITTRDNGKLIGCLLAKDKTLPSGRHAYLSMLTGVDEEYRNKGLNGDLKNYLYELGKEAGIKYVYGHIRETNPASLRSVLKQGFKISDTILPPYKNGEKKTRIIKFI